jgi:hypothetical protein
MSPRPFKLSRPEKKLLREVVLLAEIMGFPHTIGKFQRICERNETVYKCVELNLVIKRFNFIYNSKTPLKFRFPTIKLNKDGWVVQPLAIRKDTKLACTLLHKQLGNWKCDLHWLNVGWIDGTPLLFDW